MTIPAPRSAPALAALMILAACETGGARPRPGVPVAAGSVPSAPSLEAQVRELAVASRPGPRHASLSALAGEWDVDLSLVSAAGTEAEPFHGRATLAWILGARYLNWEATIEFGGVPGTTTGYLGYDSARLEYELMMISDLSQSMEVAHGSGDLQGPGIVFTLERSDPRTGTMGRARSRIRLLASDHFVLEQLEPNADGTEHATRVWHYRRHAPVKR